MATKTRPLYWNGTALKEMSDEQLAYIRYYLRRYYAYTCTTSGSYVSPSVPFVPWIGTSSPGLISPNWNFETAAQSIPIGHRYYSEITGAQPVGNTTVPSLYTNSTRYLYNFVDHPDVNNNVLQDTNLFNSYGYLAVQYSDYKMQIESSYDNIYEYILYPAIAELVGNSNYVNDEIGSWRIALSAPGAEWQQSSHIAVLSYEVSDLVVPTYIDGNPTAVNTTRGAVNWSRSYRLYIRTDSTPQERPWEAKFGATVNPLSWDSNKRVIRELYDSSLITSAVPTIPLIKDILYPLFLYALKNTSLRYNIKTSYPTTINKGSFSMHTSAGYYESRQYSAGTYRAHYMPYSQRYYTYFLTIE